MKKQLFKTVFTALLLGGPVLSPSEVKAQTDVTSQYLTNADLEGTYSVFATPRNDGNDARAIYKPDG